MNVFIINSLKPSVYLVHHQVIMQNVYILPTQYNFVFCMNLRTNRDYLPLVFKTETDTVYRAVRATSSSSSSEYWWTAWYLWSVDCIKWSWCDCIRGRNQILYKLTCPLRKICIASGFAILTTRSVITVIIIFMFLKYRNFAFTSILYHWVSNYA